MTEGTIGSGFAHFEVPDFEAQTVTVIIRSSPEVARNTVDMTEIWGGEITIENVKVRRSTRN